MDTKNYLTPNFEHALIGHAGYGKGKYGIYSRDIILNILNKLNDNGYEIPAYCIRNFEQLPDVITEKQIQAAQERSEQGREWHEYEQAELAEKHGWAAFCRHHAELKSPCIQNTNTGDVWLIPADLKLKKYYRVDDAVELIASGVPEPIMMDIQEHATSYVDILTVSEVHGYNCQRLMRVREPTQGE